MTAPCKVEAMCGSGPGSHIHDATCAPDPDPLNGLTLPEAIAFCRANGVRKLTYRGMELEFGPAPAAAMAPEALQQFSEAMAGAVPSDEEFLGWSAGGDFTGDLAAIQRTIYGDDAPPVK